MLPWYESGSHKCLVCQSKIFLGSVKKHLTLVHKLSMDEYLVIFEMKDSDFAIPDWKCLVCGGAVPHTLCDIRSHLWVKHSIPMADYYFKYVKDLIVKDQSDCLETSSNNNNNSDLRNSEELKNILEFCFQNILKRMNSVRPDSRFVEVEVVAENVGAGMVESEIAGENYRNDHPLERNDESDEEVDEEVDGEVDEEVDRFEEKTMENYEIGGEEEVVDKNKKKNTDAVDEATLDNIEQEEVEEDQETAPGNSEEFQLNANNVGERYIVKRTENFPNNDGFSWKLVGKRKQQYFFRQFVCKQSNCEGMKKIRMFGNNKRRCSTPNHKMEVVYLKGHSCQNREATE